MADSIGMDDSIRNLPAMQQLKKVAGGMLGNFRAGIDTGGTPFPEGDADEVAASLLRQHRAAMEIITEFFDVVSDVVEGKDHELKGVHQMFTAVNEAGEDSVVGFGSQGGRH